MEELKKVRRVVEKADPAEPSETWLVPGRRHRPERPATGQEIPRGHPLTGVIVTKLDGTAKGGILVAIVRELGVPIKFIGVANRPTTCNPLTARNSCAPCST